jgi:hypothetical protein
MSVSVPFSFSGTLLYPPDSGAPNAQVSVAGAGAFTQKAEFKFELSGSGTQDVNFGSIATAGAKFILIEVEPDTSLGAAPINVRVNGGDSTGQIEIAPGGAFLLYSPVPTAGGVLALSLVYTAAATVWVRVLG